MAKEVTCELLDTRDGHCGWCSKKLTGRQKKWCSRHCNRMFIANHRWTQARAAALKEAGAFYLCKNAEIVLAEGGVMEAVSGPAWPECVVFTDKPEVNHMVPVRGKHGTWGCHHHQTGLEVLCRPCHLAATAKQREEGLI